MRALAEKPLSRPAQAPQSTQRIDPTRTNSLQLAHGGKSSFPARHPFARLGRTCYTLGMSLESTVRGYGAPRRKRRGLELVFILGFLFSLIVGGVALVALWLVSRQDPADATTVPSPLLVPEEVVVGLATRQLKGDPLNALVSQALLAGELHTAAALLLFDTQSSAPGRVALWQQLGRRWLEQQEFEFAVLAYGRTVGLAAADLALKPLERSQLLTQAAAGMAAAQDEAAALVAALQAKRVITQAPDLLPAQRSQLLQPLKTLVAGLQPTPEVNALAAEIDDLLRNPYVAPSGILLANSWSIVVAAPPPDLTVQAAVASRELAALNLAERYVVTGGIDTEPERQALAVALLAEDQARNLWYRAGLESASSLQQQLGYLVEQQRWLTLKLQVAWRAFGLTILPEWEAARPAFEGELNGLIANTEAVIRSLADAQPTPLEQALLRGEGAHWLALQSSLGLYPGANNVEISERLRVAQTELEQLGAALALPVVWEGESALPGFRIQPR